MTETISALLIFAGSVIIFLAAVGILRFPDTLTRMAAASTATTLGGVLIGLGAFVSPELEEVRAQSAFFTVFLMVALPVAAHSIGRAGLMRKMPLAPGTERRDSPENETYRRPRSRI